MAIASMLASLGGGCPTSRPLHTILLDLPRWLESLGFEVTAADPIAERARPADFLWQWPRAFVVTGLERLVDLGRVSAERARAMRAAFDEVERTPGAFMLTPTVLEIVARKRGGEGG